jgi:T-complex protein 1 subunit beta
MVDEAERSLHDALSVLSQTVKETRVVLGGGCAEMLMSCAVEEEGRRIKGKKALAVESFGKALRQVRRVSRQRCRDVMLKRFDSTFGFCR